MAKIIKTAPRRKFLTAVFFDPPVEAYGEIFDGETPLLINKSTFEESPYKEGSDLSPEDVEDLIDESDFARAKSKGLWLLSGRDYSKKEIIQWLRRDFDDDSAEAAADRLEELGLINDENYAMRKAESFLLSKKISERAAIIELRRLGIDEDMARQAVEEVEYDPIEQIAELINRKYSGWDEDEKIRNRMIAALQRKGHHYSNIKEALEQIADEYD